jgi:hypothetical protein
MVGVTVQLRRLLLAAPVGVTVCLMVSGCAKHDANRGVVAGQVKLDGRPLEDGSILFTPIEGTKGTVAGGRIQQGQYRLTGRDGPAVGKNRVEIRAVRKSGKMVLKPMSPSGEMVDAYESAVAPRFNTKSTLTAVVEPGDNTASFEVESK